MGSSGAPFGAVFGHFEAPQKRSNTKQKVERTRHPHFSRMSLAKSLFSSVGVSKQALRIAIFWRMSQAKRPFPSIRAISRPISTSPFSEDVSGESLIFDIKRLKTKLSRSHFLEDVSGKTAILGGTYPDKNGKRRFSEIACARAHPFAPNTHVCTWGAVARLPCMPRWLPLVACA